ncbi:glucosidase [Mucilaginibacter sp. UR6-1]|uniref:MGH1-like glycoside hydrolase domain-containing protein n=1 Tax=Mucilaginibacter sp. UR6-1 TaxID=1435643 RepID=UPI001E659843|nr:glucosidase [Mucilaginibacter sp. UR6-1]MCC8408500.1 glucosidase [Mucilaginibacter sp. UR6-1]
MPETTEEQRLKEHYEGKTDWLKWGPYLSERQWGTVREDYSANGDAWNYITHDMARSKAYRWGEEGIAGICDDKQHICLSLALWNGRDPILKERLFGLTNHEGNHGEDVKELYYYLDNTPAHTYMKMLYKYPQQAYPYDVLIQKNAAAGKDKPEFELIDTGIFDNNAYFDVFAEYVKADHDDVLIQYTIYNRGSEKSSVDVLPQIWFRKTWLGADEKPAIKPSGKNAFELTSAATGTYYLYFEEAADPLFTNNETNRRRLYKTDNEAPYVKDGFNDYIVNGKTDAVNPGKTGTKAAVWHHFELEAGGKAIVRLRLSRLATNTPFTNFDETISVRITEADEFYAAKQTNAKTPDERLVQRQAWAGLLWSKQYYKFNVKRWLDGDAGKPVPPAGRRKGRNANWKHFVAEDILLMPDTWEYPWFAAWDHAFHCIAVAPIDAGLAKKQLQILIGVNHMHPNGQIPAYEWDFNDTNPPVQAVATLQVYEMDKAATGKGDQLFLESVFQKLLLNFTWWVNRKDSEGNNIFEGGFLGLDNIGIFNRSQPVPGGGFLEQADGTSWMAMYALNMMRMAMELAINNKAYESMAIKFAEHFMYIAGSIANMGEETEGLWDDEDGFYYDLLKKPNCSWERLKLRSIVGLIPLFAVSVFKENQWQQLPELINRLEWFKQQRPDLVELVSRWRDVNGDQHLFSLLRGHRMKLLLKRMLDPEEFLSDYGIRSLSKKYDAQPYKYMLNGADYSVKYIPGESDSNMFGGNSNWRGPVWFPLNYLIICSLRHFHEYYTDDFKVEYPTRSGQYLTLSQIADELSKRLQNLFLTNERGERPVNGGRLKFNFDEQFKQYIPFFEYFNPETGEGLGAGHQTGWTALVALLF